MKKNIWIWNHYATEMMKDQAGRHYWFADNLIKRNYNVTIFCSSTSHNSSDTIAVGDKRYLSDVVNGIPCVFIKTPPYIGNGKQRIRNMAAFYWNLFPIARQHAKAYGKPDLILASSVHPLTLVAGIKIAKKMRIPCICEVRDLWPESLVAYGYLDNDRLLAKLLYWGEKWIYKRASKIIFTMEGGKDHIIEKGWAKEKGGPIDTAKVYYINNGVDLKKFDKNAALHQISDHDLDNPDLFKVVYTGSIRLVNKVGEIVKAARILKDQGNDKIKFLIWGDGDQREALQQYIEELGLDNIVFKGKVEKKYIPYILSKSNLNIYILPENPLYRFGLSLNKSFEYFASGKPVLASATAGYSLIDRYKCGKTLDHYDVRELADEIISFYKMPQEQYREYCMNARIAAQEFDFKKLTDDLIRVIESA